MIEIKENELIVCSDLDCNNQIKKRDDLYFVQDKTKGYGRGICADCWMKQMRALEHKFEAKKTGGKEMCAPATIKEPVCEEPGCGLPIAADSVFYLVPDANGIGQVICANCRMKMMAFLEDEFSRKRKARDEAEKKLHECVAALSRVTCAQKGTA